MKLIAGTDKGLLVYTKAHDKWILKDIHFIGLPIGYFHNDERNKTWWIAVNHKHWGPKLYKSKNQGESFEEVASPKFNQDSNQSVKSIWTISHGENDDSNTFYIGVEPAAIFRTSDGGQNFEELKGLSSHPSRSSWQGGGKGSNNPFLHTILVDEEDKTHLTVGISSAGVFQSFNAGQTWEPTNKGLEAFFLPESDVIVGHDPHALKIPKSNLNVVWQQNHCGIYRSEDKGKSWKNVTDKNGFANYGFAIVQSNENDQTAWVIPAQSDHMRIPHDCKLAVYQTKDGGESWHALTNGLPQNGAFDLILRAGFDGKGTNLSFGSNNGNLYFSADEGENWEVVSQNLSAIRSVTLI
jgi:photosystem II stability/assembly factor-like uncharacterized protein